MKRVLALGLLLVLGAVAAVQFGAGVVMAVNPQTQASPTPFVCTKDAQGKCNQLLLNTPKCVAIGLPIAPGAPGGCTACIGIQGTQTSNCTQGPNDGSPGDPGVQSPGVSNDPATGGALVNYLRGWLRLLNGAVALVVMLMLVIAGIQYITSLANPTNIAAAKKRITDAIIALVMWLMMFAALQFLMPGGLL